MADEPAPLGPASLRLGAAVATLGALPLVVGGLWADLLPAAQAPALAGALGLQLALAVWALPGLWAALRPGESKTREGAAPLGVTLADLAVVVACAAPSLALAARFSALPPAASAAAVVHALALLGALAVWLALGAPQAGPTRVALVAAWTAALPLVVVIAADQLALVSPAALAWLAPPLGQQAAVDGRLGLAVAAGVAPPLLLVALGRPWRRGAAVGLALGLTLVAGGGARAEPRVERAEPLLRDAARPGEPWPLWLELAGAVEVSAGARTRVVAPAAPVGVTLLPAVPVAGGPLDLAARGPDGEWSRLEAPGLAPRPLRTQELLVGHLGARVRALAATLAGSRRAVLVPLTGRDARALAEAGLALDLVVVARGEARDPAVAGDLRRWAAAGGVLAFDDAGDLERVAGDLAAPGGVAGPWRVRPIGAGLLVGPAPGELGLVVPTGPAGATAREQERVRTQALERLALRLRARARRDGLVEAALAARPPGPSRALGGRVALTAGGAALGLTLVLLVAARLPRARGAAAVALAGAVLAAGLPPLVAPATPVWAASVQVLEAPAGASAAGRVEVLALAAPRALGAKVDLAPGGLPLPALLTAAAALEEVTLAPGERPAAWLPVGPVTRALVRVDAIGLPRPDGQAGGAFRLTRGRTGQAVRIENGTALPLDRVLAITDRGVYGLDALPPGHAYERDLDLLVPPVPFARWRVMTVEDEDERAWRALVTAALAGRDLRGRLVLVGRGPPVARVEGGVAEEQPARPLVVITASDETSGR